VNKLVIFDLDGVLFESRDMHYEALNHALMYHGFAPIAYEDHLKRFNGLPTRKKLDMLIEERENGGTLYIARESIEKTKQTATQNWIRTNVQRDLKLISLLQTLQHRMNIAVVSNAVRDTVVAALDRLWLTKFVNIIVTPGSGFYPKPDPAMYFNAMARAFADPTTTTIVEDSPVGIEAARATGARVIEVTGPDEVPPKVWEALINVPNPDTSSGSGE
jgi:HAD superfamily hydrolase (TIGR01509 family)